jgi:hypothetical protein
VYKYRAEVGQFSKEYEGSFLKIKKALQAYEWPLSKFFYTDFLLNRICPRGGWKIISALEKASLGSYSRLIREKTHFL